jgi:acetyl esterase/lipase
MLLRCTLVGALVVGWLVAAPSATAQKAPKLPDNVELMKDVEYGKGGDRPLKMHILRPKVTPKDPMPVLVWIHGGAWMGGSRDSGIDLLAPFAARGYFCASIEYRFSQEALFPAQIEDCKCAVRFLRAKASEYHIDPERIGVWGASAGGHLVALLGTSGHVKELEGKGGWADQSSRVQAVCDFCGPTDFPTWGEAAHPAVLKLLGGTVSEKKELAAKASPVTYVTKDCPEFLIIHGDKDTTVPVNQSELLRDALRKAGTNVTLTVVKDGGHVFPVTTEMKKQINDFFDKNLLPPKPPK